MPMHARVLPAANRTEVRLLPVTEPTTVRLAYEGAVVVAAIEPINRYNPIIQCTIEDEVHRLFEIWSATPHHDVVVGGWWMSICSLEELHRSSIAAVSCGVLRAIDVCEEQGPVPGGSHVEKGR